MVRNISFSLLVLCIFCMRFVVSQTDTSCSYVDSAQTTNDNPQNIIPLNNCTGQEYTANSTAAVTSVSLMLVAYSGGSNPSSGVGPVWVDIFSADGKLIAMSQIIGSHDFQPSWTDFNFAQPWNQTANTTYLIQIVDPSFVTYSVIGGQSISTSNCQYDFCDNIGAECSKGNVMYQVNVENQECCPHGCGVSGECEVGGVCNCEGLTGVDAYCNPYINECQNNNGGCSPLANCSWAPGFPVACGSCPPGFAGTGNTSCLDIDECNDTSLCALNASCNNTIGGFTCYCPAGFIGDGLKSCTPAVVTGGGSNTGSGSGRTAGIIIGVILGFIIIIVAAFLFYRHRHESEHKEKRVLEPLIVGQQQQQQQQDIQLQEIRVSEEVVVQDQVSVQVAGEQQIQVQQQGQASVQQQSVAQQQQSGGAGAQQIQAQQQIGGQVQQQAGAGAQQIQGQQQQQQQQQQAQVVVHNQENVDVQVQKEDVAVEQIQVTEVDIAPPQSLI